jgi:HrpA-like RNA helicase
MIQKHGDRQQSDVFVPAAHVVVDSVAHVQPTSGVEDLKVTVVEQPPLPIMDWLPEIGDGIKGSDVGIVKAGTGAGKTTKITQLCARLGWRSFCAQPNRSACEWNQAEVQRQFGGENGEIVGFQHGRGEMFGQNFKILFCTAGLLFERIVNERYFENYSRENYNDVIILDECHLFTLEIEFILALYREARQHGAVPKLVVMSATIDTEELERFLRVTDSQGQAKDIPVFNVPGRQYKIELREPRDAPEETVLELLNEGRGHVLHFKPGVAEIDQAIDALGRYEHPYPIVPIHGKQSLKEQRRVNNLDGLIAYIPATNVVETSVTIPDVYAVVNDGLERVPVLNGDEEILALKYNSKFTHEQRLGRAGRVKDGVGVNLGPSPDKLPHGYWDTQHAALYRHYLSLIVAGKDPLTLELLHEPSDDKKWETMTWLRNHGLIDANGLATEMGRFASTLPVQPREAKMLFYGVNLPGVSQDLIGCLIDVAAIVGTRDFRGINSESLFKLVKPELHRLIKSSDNLANLCALEAIFQESDVAKRSELFDQYGIRQAAVDDVLYQREDIAARLGERIPPFGVRNLANIPFDQLLEASVCNWSDYIFRYVGRDKKGAALYRQINDSSAPLRKLSRGSYLGVPHLVTGKLFSIGLKVDIKSEEDILRLITQASVVPRGLFNARPELKEIEKQVVRYRDLERKNK